MATTVKFKLEMLPKKGEWRMHRNGLTSIPIKTLDQLLGLVTLKKLPRGHTFKVRMDLLCAHPKKKSAAGRSP